MAKVGIDSFLLDCHTNDNISEIEAEYGVKGFAVVVRLWQKIYCEKGYYCEWVERSPLLFLSNWFGGNSGVTINLIREIVDRCLNNGIFNAEMYENYSILTSARIQKQYFDVVKRREEIPVKKEYLLVSVGKIKGIAYENEVSVRRNQKNVYRNDTSKVKESKENLYNIVETQQPDDNLSEFERYNPSEFERKCVDYLVKSILTDFPRQKVPKTENEIKKWAIHIKRLHEIDGIETEKIWNTLVWTMKNPFWRTNIRSTGKFREKFQTLYLQSKQKGKNNSFNNFEQNKYDFNALEKELLSN